MTDRRVDFQSTDSEPLGLEPRVVQLAPVKKTTEKVGNRK
jgi:hypothetical protein